MRLQAVFVAVALAAGITGAEAQQEGRPLPHVIRSAYQGGAATQTERLSRRFPLGRDGRVSVQNIAGEIIVTGGSGNEVVIEAMKRTRGDQSELARVQIEIEARGGRVDIQTVHPRQRGDRVWVDYTISMPAAAALEV